MNQKEIAERVKELKNRRSEIILLIHQKKVDKKKKVHAIRRKKEALIKNERHQLSSQITEQHNSYLSEIEKDKKTIRDLDKQIEALLNSKKGAQVA